MNEELIEERGWIKRNWKWLVPSSVIVIISVIILLLLGSVSTGADFASAFADNALYENAVKKANENKEVQSLLGTIGEVDKMAILESNIEYTNDKQSVNLTVRVKGDAGKGKMDVVANKQKGEWVYSLIKIRMKDPKKEILVLE